MSAVSNIQFFNLAAGQNLRVVALGNVRKLIEKVEKPEWREQLLREFGRFGINDVSPFNHHWKAFQTRVDEAVVFQLGKTANFQPGERNLFAYKK